MKTANKLAIPAEVARLDAVLNFIYTHLDSAGCHPDTREIIAIAVEEIFINIARYAYSGGGGTAWIHCSVGGTPRRAVIELSDAGIPYNPLLRPDPDITLGEGGRPIGGLGIYMVKNSMDRVVYKRENELNVLTIEKNI